MEPPRGGDRLSFDPKPPVDLLLKLAIEQSSWVSHEDVCGVLWLTTCTYTKDKNGRSHGALGPPRKVELQYPAYF